MKRYWKFYGFVMQLKMYMALYALGLIMIGGVYNLFMGSNSIRFLHIFEMILTAFGMSIIQYFAFPAGKELTDHQLCANTVWYALGINALVIPVAWLCGWFINATPLAIILLVCGLEFILAAMWVGLHIALKMESKALNDSLEAFHEKA